MTTAPSTLSISDLALRQPSMGASNGADRGSGAGAGAPAFESGPAGTLSGVHGSRAERARAEPATGATASTSTRATSCYECRKRKRRCDKQVPCSECSRRRTPHLCRTDSRPSVPFMSLETLGNQLRQHEERLAHLESLLRRLHPGSLIEAGSTADADARDENGGLELPDEDDQPADIEYELLAHKLAPTLSSAASTNGTVLDGRLGGNGHLLGTNGSNSRYDDRGNASHGHRPGQNGLESVLSSIRRDRASPTLQQPPQKAIKLSKEGLAFSKILATSSDFDIFDSEPQEDEAAQWHFANPSNGLYPTIRSKTPFHKLSPWAQTLHRHLLEQLPPATMIKSMASMFFDGPRRMIHGINRPQFMSEVEELEVALMHNQGAEVDPAWLALLFIIIAFGLLGEFELRGTIFGVGTGDQIFYLSERFGQCAQGALAAASWATTPSLRVVQTLVVIGWYNQHLDPSSGSFNKDPEPQRYRTAIAAMHCQAFGIDKLGDDKTQMPKPDSAFGSTNSGFRRQMALRLWEDYRGLEMMTGYCFHDRSAATSARPVLCNDEDLGWSLDVLPRPFSEEPGLVFKQQCYELTDHLHSLYTLQDQQTITFQQAQVIADDLRNRMFTLIRAVNELPSFKPPGHLLTRETYTASLRLYVEGGGLRIWRMAFGRLHGMEAEACMQQARTAARETVAILSGESALRILTGVMMATSFLLNACIMIIKFLAEESDASSVPYWVSQLASATDTFQLGALQSPVSTVATNCRRALVVLAKFASRLEGQPGPAEDSLKLLKEKLGGIVATSPYSNNIINILSPSTVLIPTRPATPRPSTSTASTSTAAAAGNLGSIQMSGETLPYTDKTTLATQDDPTFTLNLDTAATLPISAQTEYTDYLQGLDADFLLNYTSWS